MRVAKFLSVDPGGDHDLTKPQSWNKYAYVRNNPINKIDPDGRVGEFIGPWVMQIAATLTGQLYPQPGEQDFVGPPAPPLLPLSDDLHVNYGSRVRPYFAPEVARALDSAIRQLNGLGITPTINSAYRNDDDQNRMRNGASGSNPAAQGTSLHQAGYAVDIDGTGRPEFKNVRTVMDINGFSWGGHFRKTDRPHFYMNPFGTTGTTTYRQGVAEAARQAQEFHENFIEP